MESKTCVCGHPMTAHEWKNQWVCHRCGRTKPIEEVMTNADRIRAMTDEELKDLLWDAYNAGSNDAEAWHFGEGHRFSFEWDLDWLQQPAEV